MIKKIKLFLGDSLFFIIFHPIFFIRYLRIKLLLRGRISASFPVYFGKNIYFRYSRNDKFKILIGKNCRFNHEIWFEIKNNSELFIGDNSTLTRYIIIQCAKGVSIGNDALISEFVSIRDSQHRYDGAPFRDQGYHREKIQIGTNVWVGKSSIILPGVSLGDNTIVAANSLVNSKFEGGQIVGGTPSKSLKNIDVDSD